MDRAVMAPYANRIKPLPATGEIGPGVEAIALPGHTLGHSGYVFTSGNERLLIWGDVVHNAALQFARPDWTLAFDLDQAKAAATRKRVFDMAASDRLLVAGMHLPYPGLGFIERNANEYRFHPDFWRSSL
jgi:glyoxylase-like metal-dependent hydrolase (beta-lactamase superfamily II)